MPVRSDPDRVVGDACRTKRLAATTAKGSDSIELLSGKTPTSMPQAPRPKTLRLAESDWKVDRDSFHSVPHLK